MLFKVGLSMQKIKLIGLMLCFLFAGVITARIFFITDSSDIEATNIVYDTLPSITAFNLHSEVVNLSEDLNSGKINVIFVYSLGCNSCISAANKWAEIYALKKNEINFLGLAYSSDREKVRSFVQSFKLDFKHRLIDQHNANKIQVNDWPTILGVDRNNNVLFKFEGSMSTDSLSSYLSSNIQMKK
ncbi:MAG: hypothetical protein FH748_10665 [Balneolaceae bacterium]|nr:hypothetical protein [Balneolaceae bacterium]